jgi:hypothetical protein
MDVLNKNSIIFIIIQKLYKTILEKKEKIGLKKKV